TVVQNGQPLSAVLKMVARRAPSGVAERMTQLAVDLHWLAEQVAVKPPVHELLRDLEQRLGYAQALAKESGGEELGRARAVMVHAFIAFAEGQGSVDQILGTQAQFDKQSRRGRARVTITTIFRAKGLEWP